MVRGYGISRSEAVARVNRQWSQADPPDRIPRVWIVGLDIACHEDADYWAAEPPCECSEPTPADRDREPLVEATVPLNAQPLDKRQPRHAGGGAVRRPLRACGQVRVRNGARVARIWSPAPQSSSNWASTAKCCRSWTIGMRARQSLSRQVSSA